MTPIFALARMTGWTAHVREQYANNKVIRPAWVYVGPRDQIYAPSTSAPATSPSRPATPRSAGGTARTLHDPSTRSSWPIPIR